MEYSKSAEKVLELAKEVSESFGQNYIGSEHVLLALLKEPKGTAHAVLRQNNVTDKQISELVEQLIAPGGTTAIEEMEGYTPRVLRILDSSETLAIRYKSNEIGTEHILISMLKEGENTAVRLLTTLSINIPKLYAETLSAMGFDQRRIRQELNLLKNGLSFQHDGSSKDAVQTPTLDRFSRDLTELAGEGKLDPVIGRENEIMRVIQILNRRTKNNPCLVGEPGVGKTAIAEGLAVKISEGSVPDSILGCRVVSLDMSGMVAGTKYRGEFEERIKNVIAEVIQAGNILLFMDEIHTLIGAGGAEGSIDASSILKPSLARGELQLIGATTLDEYRKYIEKDAALERRFQPVTVEEPSEKEAIEVLMGIKHKYEEHHGIEISKEAVEAAVKLSARYISDRFLPDKAIDVMDEAASRLRIVGLSSFPALKTLSSVIERLTDEEEKAIREGDFEKAGELHKERQKKLKKFEKHKSKYSNRKKGSALILSEDDIAEVVAVWTRIPVTKLTEKENDKLKSLEDILHKRVIGQNEAVEKVAKAIRRGRTLLKDPKRPTGSFLFLGPTGVGKTELSKALAEALFGTEESLIRIDMSEFMEPQSVSKMIGSPPGYVGYDEGGQLAEKIRRHPYSVVLFDEIEKAHPDVFNVLLQVLDDGHITDSKGRKVSFRNAIIIMTSNAGAQRIVDPKKLGFGADFSKETEYKDMKSGVMEEVKRIFKPEFINRIDDIVVFRTLDRESLRSITNLLCQALIDRTSEQLNIKLDITDKVRDFVLEKGTDAKFGARPLKRAIQNLIEDKLAMEIVSGNCGNGEKIRTVIKDDEVSFKISDKSKAKEKEKHGGA